MKQVILLIVLLPVLQVFSQNIDIDLLRDINLNRNKNMDGFYRGVSSSVTPVVIATPLIILADGLIKKDSLTLRNGLYISAAVASTAIISTALKYSVNRTRPFVTYPEIEKIGKGGSPSFPSGHTSDAFALATSLSISFPKWYVVIPSCAWAAWVGYSRMDLGVHYPSDVLAGAALGAGSAYLTSKTLKWINKKR
ncbi:MAG: phosphatase PAP2 family protein [Bacteroidales bacterium]|nr:phosphatase PAP2 family protein [Bacteroidales bacterium]MCB8998562.1 phosphatase PAP2 family protein [Bacteroidales bacterium]MCB9012570.1 phosphatase PAP2 family protein [Bacteroidales bacterium]